MEIENFWYNETVLVTGADGFIGSHLVEYLLSKGANVKALVKYNSFNSWGWLDGIEESENLQIISGDICDPFFCQELIQNVDYVFHLAALIAIPFSYKSPALYIQVNTSGTLNMCQASLKKVKKFIHFSTSEVYGTAKYVPIDENHPMQPQSPYSASKIGADSVVKSYFSSFGLPAIIARPFNTYGPRQSARAVIPTIISQILSGREKIALGEISPTRDFNYVLDTCMAVVAICEKVIPMGQEINIGSGKEISIGDLFYKIRNIIGSNSEIDLDYQRIRPPKSEVFRLLADTSKFQELVGNFSKTSLEDGLTLTINWLKKEENLKKYKIGAYNV